MKTIFLADDDADDGVIFLAALKKQDREFSVSIAGDGVELMEKLMNSAPHIPDYLFLDLQMPKKNGLDCLSEIREIDAFKDMRVIIFTTSLIPEEIEAAYNLGADLYFPKPMSMSEYHRIINKIFENPLAARPPREDFVLE